MPTADHPATPRPTLRPVPLLVALLALLLAARVGAAPSDDSTPALDLATIMADPEWIGRAPHSPAWTDDGTAIVFRRERAGSDLDDLWVQRIDEDEATLVADEERARFESLGGDRDTSRTRRVFTRDGDVFLADVTTGEERPLTRTSARESRARFLAGDTHITYHRDDAVIVRELATGLETEPLIALAEDEPDDDGDDEPEGFLEEQQDRLFEIVRERRARARERRDREEELRDADPTRGPEPFHLGDDVSILDRRLSPTGTAMLVELGTGRRSTGRRDSMPEWVTADGYVEARSVRSLVGTGERTSARLVMLSLEPRAQIDIDLATLPGIRDDPLAEVRDEVRAWREATDPPEHEDDDPEDGDPEEDEDDDEDDDEGDDGAVDDDAAAEDPEPRAVTIFGTEWSDDGARAAFFARSVDNKDRWLCTVDTDGTLRVVEHLHDPAWINWRYNEFGWLPDGRLWFLSEATGYSHLWIAALGEGGWSTRALTRGAFEVDAVTTSHDGTLAYLRARPEHPGTSELYAVDFDTGGLEAITALGGRNRFLLAPDERHVAILHSTTTRPDEIYVQPLRADARARRLTHTVSAAFTSIAWTEPRVVAIPSSQIDASIWSRLYLPAPDAPGVGPDGRRAAVLFVHGAGYLQNAHLGWSHYFREFMFHSVLARAGYVVLDMDYRASAGYGRAWRTAIYREMGTPELEDLLDGFDWLVAHHGVDPERVGLYGGSYGGFMTLMALFKAPDRFACGAALRPVTDWAHYNHGYTSNILNTPEVDPIAYRRSSPIEFAEGLADPLLICHGMLDDNVFFKDTVRLAQRLIELEKTDWEVALYPVEPHGFVEPSSWLDEYRRIRALFDEHLGPRATR